MLAIDIGNTNITAGIFEGSDLLDVFRLPTQECIKASAFLSRLPGIRKEIARETVMVSVRREATKILVREVKDATGKAPTLVDMNTPMGITVDYGTKETLGIDRLVCAAAAFRLYGCRVRPLIVVDMGTATTIDYVSQEGVFMGGMIAPGIMSAYEGLLAAAPQLPRLEGLSAGGLIGKTTSECVRSGVVMGHACMIQKAVEMMSPGKDSKPVVVLTGGPSCLVAEGVPKTYIIDNQLILKGLCLLSSKDK